MYPRLWRHPGYRALNKVARELALYCLAGPQSNRIGVTYFSLMTAADDLGVTVETLRERLPDVTSTFGWLFDADAKVLYIPSWWRWNCPDNPNVLEGNLKDLNEIPPCALVEAFARNLEHVPEKWHQTFVECCAKRIPKRSANQDQDQDLEQEKKQAALSRGAVNEKAQNPEVLKIAREALRYGSPEDIELLLDHFKSLYLAKHPGTDCPRADALHALNVAISERRAN
jgi:hypothetical protein